VTRIEPLLHQRGDHVNATDQQLEASQRMLHAQQTKIERYGDRLRRIAYLLDGPAHEEDASDAVMMAYAIAREAR
jgi:hypothetical protein